MTEGTSFKTSTFVTVKDYLDNMILIDPYMIGRDNLFIVEWIKYRHLNKFTAI